MSSIGDALICGTPDVDEAVGLTFVEAGLDSPEVGVRAAVCAELNQIGADTSIKAAIQVLALVLGRESKSANFDSLGISLGAIPQLPELLHKHQQRAVIAVIPHGALCHWPDLSNMNRLQLRS